ncbi:MAG TPA: alpha/beta hydrolase [Acidimicrobiales bacterium]
MSTTELDGTGPGLDAAPSGFRPTVAFGPRSLPPTGETGPRLLTADGIDLATRCWSGRHWPRGVVVIAHGLSATKDDLRVVSLASELHRRGFDVITYDSRGHGQSGGHCTLGDLERHDVAAAVEWARRRSGRVILVGASMGAVAVLGYAAEDPDLAGVVAVSSPGEWKLPLRTRSIVTAALARTRPGRLFVRWRARVRIAPWTSPEPPRALVARVRCPVVVVHGQKDPIIPFGVGLARFVTPGPRVRVVAVPGMGHAFDPIGHQGICDGVGLLAGPIAPPVSPVSVFGLPEWVIT